VAGWKWQTHSSIPLSFYLTASPVRGRFIFVFHSSSCTFVRFRLGGTGEPGEAEWGLKLETRKKRRRRGQSIGRPFPHARPRGAREAKEKLHVQNQLAALPGGWLELPDRATPHVHASPLFRPEVMAALTDGRHGSALSVYQSSSDR
jgi:hypothetical protein